MATRTPRDADEQLGIDAAETGRYAGIRLRDGTVMVYDTAANDAWFHADSGVDLDRMA